MNTNPGETFTRTSPPLNRFVVKLGGPAPWEILTAADARAIARYLELDGWTANPQALHRYADAVDAITKRDK